MSGEALTGEVAQVFAEGKWGLTPMPSDSPLLLTGTTSRRTVFRRIADKQVN